MIRTPNASVLAMMAFLPLGCGDGGGADVPRESPAVAVRTVTVEQSSFPVRLVLSGTLQGDRQTVLVARLQSVVTGVRVKVGQRVTAGQRLLDLDPRGVQSQYRQTEALYRDAQNQLGKLESLYATGAVSERELELARTQHDVARANFEAARRAVEIEAPIAGVVTDLYVRTGDEVGPGAQLVEVADVGALRLVLDVPTTQIGDLRAGQPARACAPTDTALCMDGTVHSIADAADRDTRSFEVECRFTTPVTGFAPGTFVSAEITVRTLDEALSVPREAVIYRSGAPYVYAVDADSVMLVRLDILSQSAGRMAVAGPLTPGQRVVVAGHKNLTPGARVREAAS